MIGTIALGPLVLRADLLIFLLSAVFGYIVLAIRFRDIEAKGWLKDTYVNVLAIGFFLWKFNMLIFDPLNTIRNPLSLLYFSGGQRGLWLGFIGALLYLTYRAYRNRPFIVSLVKAAVLAYGAVQTARFTMLWLWEGAVGWQFPLYIVLFAALSAAAWIKFGSSLKSFVPLVLWYSIGSAMIPFLNENRGVVFAGFSIEQLLFILFAVSLLILDSLWDNK